MIRRCSLVLTLLGITLTPPKSPAAEQRAVLHWRPGEVEGFVLSVPRPQLEVFLASRQIALAAELDKVAAQAAAIAEEETAHLASVLLRHLSSYGDWAYGWVESYVTAYLVAGRAIDRHLNSERRDNSIVQDYRAELIALAAARFHDAVLRPAEADARLAAAAQRVVSAVEDGWASSLAEERAAWRGFIAREAQVLGRTSSDTEMRCTPTLPLPHVQGRIEPAYDESLLMLRAARPFIGRGALLSFRLMAGGAFRAEPTAMLAVVMQPSVGLASTIAATTLSLWGGDWMLSRLDEILHRGDFEARIIRDLDSARQLWTENLRRSVWNALQQGAAARALCPMAGEIRDH